MPNSKFFRRIISVSIEVIIVVFAPEVRLMGVGGFRYGEARVSLELYHQGSEKK